MINLAVKAVTEKHLTIQKASEVFEISQSVLSDRISRKRCSQLQGHRKNRKSNFDTDSLRKLFKLTSTKKGEEILKALKSGNVSIKDAAKLIKILCTYLQKETESSFSGHHKQCTRAAQRKSAKTQQVNVASCRNEDENQQNSSDGGSMEESEEQVEIEEDDRGEQTEGFRDQSLRKQRIEAPNSDPIEREGDTEMLQKKTQRKYTVLDMQQAVDAVKKYGQTLRFASRKYSIPKSTLRDVITGKSKIGCKRRPKPLLAHDEEQRIVG